VAIRYASLFVISRFQAEIERLLQEASSLGAGELPGGEWQPAVDVAETPDSVLILVEAPGLEASSLKVEVRGTLVSVSGVKPAGLPNHQRLRFHCLERGHGRFVREIHVFAPVNTHRGTARLADGLLTIELPKIEDKRMTARVLPIGEPEEER
jgi:HSP20 family molecular chaperone IbpA